MYFKVSGMFKSHLMDGNIVSHEIILHAKTREDAIKKVSKSFEKDYDIIHCTAVPLNKDAIYIFNKV